MARFAKPDIKDVATLIADEFSHVANQELQEALAETLYGTRWLYKLGLTLLANNQEQFAHVRAQIIDYASVARSPDKLTAHPGLIVLVRSLGHQTECGQPWVFGCSPAAPYPGDVPPISVALRFRVQG